MSATRGLESVAKHGDTIILSLLPWNQLRTISLILFFRLTSFTTIWFMLSLLVFYASLARMAISTFQLLHYNNQYRTFNLWLQIFQTTDSDLDIHCAEKKFCVHRLRHYKCIFLSFIVMLVIYPLSNSGGIMHSEITVLCSGLALLSMIGLNTFTPQIWTFAIVSCMLTVIKLLSSIEKMPQLEFLAPVTGLFRVLKIDLLDPVVINVSIAYLIVFILIVICVWMAVTDDWHGTYKLLLPNLVVLIWMQLIVIFFPNSSWLRIVRGSAIFATVMMLPVVIIVLLALCLIYFLMWLITFLQSSGCAVEYFCTLGILGLTLVGKWFVDRREKLNKVFWKRSLTGIQMACGLYAVFQLLASFQNIHFVVNKPEDELNYIHWNTYHELCHMPAWNKFGTVTVHENCSHLVGAAVLWEGQVKVVKITSVQNHFEDFLSVLPTAFAEHLRCLYGVQYDDCEREEMTIYAYKLCSVIQDVMKHKCHVKHFNKYDFEVTVQVGGGYWNSADVFLLADQSYKDFMLYLQTGDQIKFNGYLYKNLGGANPFIKLTTISCIDCVFDMDVAVGVKPIYVDEYFSKVYIFVFNCLFNPFLQWK